MGDAGVRFHVLRSSFGSLVSSQFTEARNTASVAFCALLQLTIAYVETFTVAANLVVVVQTWCTLYTHQTLRFRRSYPRL